jgi:polysaccharide export outer membrane protein
MLKNSGKFLGWVIIQTVAIALAGFLSQEPLEALPLSPGDRIRLLIPEGELFSGVYEVNLDGNIQIPYLDPLSVRGLEIDEAKQLIRDTLVNRQFFQPKFLQLNVSILQWAAVQVHVSGAVFQSGRISINNRSAEERSLQQNQSSGDNPPERYLTAALRGAGGITPLANVKEVMVIRNNFVQIVDLSGVFTGDEVDDVEITSAGRSFRNTAIANDKFLIKFGKLRLVGLCAQDTCSSFSSVWVVPVLKVIQWRCSNCCQ